MQTLSATDTNIQALWGMDPARAQLLLMREMERRRAENWKPRPYQQPLWDALHAGRKRAIAAWHRRAGKDDVCLRWTAVASQRRVGNYWHMLPEAAQARKAIWDAVNPHTGKRRIDECFPEKMRFSTRAQDMYIQFKNGSSWQVLGSDNYDSLVGSPPIGVVFSEFALADPQAWAMIRPIMAENDGWALFISTTRGRNHFHRMFEFAKSDPQWFAQLLTVNDTGAISPERIDQERRELTAERGPTEAEAVIQQEYMCSWDAALPGTYYAELMRSADTAERVGLFPYVPGIPVATGWDLGIGDSTPIWMAQRVNGMTRIIDYVEGSGVGLEWYVRQLSARPYVYYDHILPHDGNTSELGTGNTRVHTLATLGLNARVLPRGAVSDRISSARQFIPTCQFNTQPVPIVFEGKQETQAEARERMARGLDSLRMYRRVFDDKLKAFKDAPLHDWASHGADAFGYLSQGFQPLRNKKPANKNRPAMDWRA